MSTLAAQRAEALTGSTIRRRHDENVVIPKDFTGRVIDPSGTFLFFGGLPIPLDDRESPKAPSTATQGYDPFPGEQSPEHAPTAPRSGRAARPRKAARKGAGGYMDGGRVA